MVKILCLSAFLVSSCPLLAGTFSYSVGSGTDWFQGERLSASFSSAMVFKWEAPFEFNSKGLDLVLNGSLGLWPDGAFNGAGITIREVSVALGGVVGSINLPNPVISVNLPWGHGYVRMPDPSDPSYDPLSFPQLVLEDDGTNKSYNSYWSISGQGTFSSISFSVIYDGVGSGAAGVPFISEVWTTATPYLPVFGVSDPDVDGSGATSGFLTVVPEPSALSLLAIGLGGLVALRRVRRTV